MAHLATVATWSDPDVADRPVGALRPREAAQQIAPAPGARRAGSRISQVHRITSRHDTTPHQAGLE